LAPCILELICPGIGGVHPDINFVLPESELICQEIVRLSSDAERIPLETEITLHEAELIPHADELTLLDCKSSLWKSFSVKEKHEYKVAIDAMMMEGASCRQTCSMVGLPHNYYTRFKEVIKKIDNFEQDTGFVSFKTNGTVLKISPGCPSLLQAIQEDLSHFNFEIRQRRIQVSTSMIWQEACHLLPSFRSKLMEAMKRIVALFTKTMSLSYQADTHTGQMNFQETEEES
jgi:hypothetical protein